MNGRANAASLALAVTAVLRVKKAAWRGHTASLTIYFGRATREEHSKDKPDIWVFGEDFPGTK